jgi:predicted  nucleic acid-binding Zn ribbon protein
MSVPTGKKRADALKHVEDLISNWYWRGQVLNSYEPVLDRGKTVECYLTIPEVTALRRFNWNLWTKAGFKSLKKLGSMRLKVRILGRNLEATKTCEHRSPKSYILCTHFIEQSSALRCGDCHLSVPLYRLPPEPGEEYGELIRWRTDYRACDALNRNTCSYERFALRQSMHLNSPLTKHGLMVCKDLRMRTGKPVYYYLQREVKRKVGRKELSRKCPRCGRTWLLSKTWHGLYDFRCDRCYLVSEIASSWWGETKELQGLVETRKNNLKANDR